VDQIKNPFGSSARKPLIPLPKELENTQLIADVSHTQISEPNSKLNSSLETIEEDISMVYKDLPKNKPNWENIYQNQEQEEETEELKN
jgi:hypothetical protein